MPFWSSQMRMWAWRLCLLKWLQSEFAGEKIGGDQNQAGWMLCIASQSQSFYLTAALKPRCSCWNEAPPNK
jgi:hypothetical protein